MMKVAGQQADVEGCCFLQDEFLLPYIYVFVLILALANNQ